MPNIKSAKKRVRTTKKETAANIIVNSTMRTKVKKLEKDLKNTTANIDNSFNDAMRSIDKALNKGLIKKNNAARKKSRLTKAKNSK